MDVRIINTVNKVGREHNLTYEQIMRESRKPELIKARNEVYVILRDQYLMTFDSIGFHFKKNHATVIHGYNKAKSDGFQIKQSRAYVQDRKILNELFLKKELLNKELVKIDEMIEYFDNKTYR